MLRALGNAFALLTVVPARYSKQVPADRMSGWFPVVGLVLGMGVWGIGTLTTHLSADTLLALLVAALTISLLAAVTRGMHWDAIADISDGWWGGHTPERRREIASDSHTGAFGVAGIVFVALIQTTALASVLASPYIAAIPLVLVLSRLSAAIASWWGRPAKATGLGSSVSARPGIPPLIVAIVTVATGIATAAAFAEPSSVFWATLCILGAIAAALPFVIARRFGGTTGDVMGASIILVETIGFVLLAFLGVIV